MEQTENHRRLVLANIARDISTWMVAVRKEKAIYHTLNMFSMDIVKKCLIGECWVPMRDLHILQKALDHGVVRTDKNLIQFQSICVSQFVVINTSLARSLTTA